MSDRNRKIMEILKKAGHMPIPELKKLTLHFKDADNTKIDDVVVNESRTVAMFTDARKKIPKKILARTIEFDATTITAILYYLIQNGTKKVAIYTEENQPLIIITDDDIAAVIK